MYCGENPKHCFCVAFHKGGPSTNTNQFQQVLLSFLICSIEGSQSCHPVALTVPTYATNIGDYIGALGVDARVSVVPLAFPIMESENKDSWGWFIHCIGVKVTQRHDLCLISDRHTGILMVMNDDYQ